MAKKNDRLTVTEAARRMNVSTKTLYRWEAQKKLVPQHTAAGRRWYTEGQITAFLPTDGAPEKKKKRVATEVRAVPEPAKVAESRPKSPPPPAQPRIVDPRDPDYIPDDSDEVVEEEM
jgi:excisionase family DNA binding protein